MTNTEIISRSEARTRGLPRFFSGKPCGKGHLAERDTAYGKCVECERARRRTKYASSPNDRKYHIEKAVQYRQVPENRIREAALARSRRIGNPRQFMLYAARARAKLSGIEFELTIKDVPEIPETCPVLGIPLFVKGSLHTDNSPTLDRINSQMGYIPGNVAIISMRANRIKGDATLSEIRLMLHWMENHQFSACSFQLSEIPVL